MNNISVVQLKYMDEKTDLGHFYKRETTESSELQIKVLTQQ